MVFDMPYATNNTKALRINDTFSSATQIDHPLFRLSTISHATAIESHITTLEQARRRYIELTQLDISYALREYLDSNYRLTTSVDATDLQALSIMRATDLDIDGQPPYDSKPCFFAPCPREYPGLEEETEYWRPIWRPTLDNPKSLLDPKWIPSEGYVYASVRARWFPRIPEHLANRYEGEIHPANVYKEHSDPQHASPRGSYGRDNYKSEPYVVPVAADKPHIVITVLEPAVAPEANLFWGELHAIIALLESRIRIGQFTDHHTKPVLIFAFQRDTHARITQAHMDARTNKIVIRQSRQLVKTTRSNTQ